MDDIKALARENSSVLCRIAPWDCFGEPIRIQFPV